MAHLFRCVLGAIISYCEVRLGCEDRLQLASSICLWDLGHFQGKCNILFFSIDCVYFSPVHLLARCALKCNYNFSRLHVMFCLAHIPSKLINYCELMLLWSFNKTNLRGYIFLSYSKIVCFLVSQEY